MFHVEHLQRAVTMLKLTKKADYGLIAMKHLAGHGQRNSCSAKDLAEAYGLPPEALAKILQRLAHAKLVVPQRGLKGGYTLARDAAEITAFEVVRAIEGPLFLTSCTTVRGACGQSARCTVREPLQRVSRSIEQALTSITVAEIADDTGMKSDTDTINNDNKSDGNPQAARNRRKAPWKALVHIEPNRTES
jgi:FeS assembly SUF system regulator